MTLNQLSGGRFLLGLGLSGPQVVEGWHGKPFSKPLSRTREYVAILRTIFRRQEPLEFQGKLYQVPYSGQDATGLGKPLRSTLEAQDIPIYLASIGPKNVELTAEIADGWLPIFFSPQRFKDIYQPLLEAGFSRAATAKSVKNFDIAPTVSVVVGDDLDACYDAVRPYLALYVGGMGAKGKNFYNSLARRYGYEEAAETIQNLFLAGKKREAGAAVPKALIDEVALVGPPERVKEHLQKWKEVPIGTLNLAVTDRRSLQTVATLLG